MTTAATAPTSPLEGDIWFDTTTGITNVYDETTTSWIVMDPDAVTVANTDVSDATNFYITNTTAADRTLTFSGFAGAFLRNGGVITDLKTSGLTLKANTRYLVHITSNGGNLFFNATEAGAGSVDTYLGNRTIRHTGTGTLDLTHALHNLADIQTAPFGGNFSINAANVNDGTTFTLTNVDAVSHSMSFSGFLSAFMVNGGAIVNIKTTGLTLDPNTKYYIKISVNGANTIFYVNEIAANRYLGNRTIHHNVTTTLAITEALHNNADIHMESTGNLSIASTAVSDATNFYITNTTAADRTLSFTGFSGAFLRNGGTETDLATGGMTLKANTRYLAHVTENSGSFFVNATEAVATAESISDKISQRENLGNSTTLGTVFNTQAASRNFIDVLNSYSVIDYTQDEVDHILSHREDFKIEILLGDRRTGTVTSRIDNFVLRNGDAAQLFPLILNDVYDFSVTLTSAGQLTVTDNHVSQANTFGGIRGIKISKNTWKPNGRNERIGINTAVLEGAVLTSGSSVNETLWGPRMISIPFDQRDTYLFIPRNPNGGVATIKASGWQQEHWYGLLTWTDNGNGLAGAAIDTVTLTSLSTSGDLSMTAAVSTANNQAIVFTFTGVHVNAHGWNFTIID